jgi:glycosyltransferase involved in cell wall biosynthesis
MIRSRIIVAIPAYNEEFSVEGVVLACRDSLPNFDLIVINDGSTDGTLEKLEKLNVEYIDLITNLGVGGAMRAAFKYARENDYDYIIQVDGDGQHDPASIKMLLRNITDYDVVIGSRFLNPNSYQIEPYRRVAIRFLSLQLQLLSGISVSDPTSGFRVSGRKAIQFFSNHYPVEYLADTVGSLMLGSRYGLKFVEMPVNMKQRQGGTPSQGVIRSVIHLLRTVVTISIIRFRSPLRVRENN